MMKKHKMFTVCGEPFFPIGGQAHNSTSYVLEDLKISFAASKKLNGNSCAVTICWDKFEPVEGQFDVKYVTDIIDLARAEELHVIFLWFGTWKNGIMSYCPAWVKLNTKRFIRALSADGTPMLNLSCHCDANWRADAAAFAKLCAVVRDYDVQVGTVLGFQVENEPGQWLGSRRDFLPAATEQFNSEVPAEVVEFIKKHPEGPTRKYWEKAGRKEKGTWTEVFGRLGPEAFSAYTVASYIDKVAGAGKREYDIFMYVNVALDGLSKGEDFEIPGVSYFSGGCVPKVRDIWYATMKNIDALCPDDYKLEANRHREALECYAQPELGWPLYVPESGIQAINSAHMMYAAADLQAIGYHIFGIESYVDKEGSLVPEAQDVARSFLMLKNFTPMLLKYQGTDKIHSIFQYTGETSMLIELDGWKCYVSFVGLKSYQWGNVGADFRHREVAKNFGKNVFDYEAEKGRGIVVQAGPDEFYAVGNGCHLFFEEYEPMDGSVPVNLLNPTIQITTLDFIEVTEGHFDADGKYAVDRIRSGDESWRGVWLAADCGVVRFTLHRREK